MKIQKSLLSLKSKTIKGFTLIELILYMGLLSILLLVLTQIFITVLEGQIEAEATSAVAGDGRFLYTRFIHDVHNADSISTPQNLGDTANTLEFSRNSISYSYSLVNGNLLFTDPTGTSQLNGINTEVSNLQFRRIGNVNGKHTFQILFTISSKGGVRGNKEIKIFQTTAGLR